MSAERVLVEMVEDRREGGCLLRGVLVVPGHMLKLCLNNSNNMSGSIIVIVIVPTVASCKAMDVVIGVAILEGFQVCQKCRTRLLFPPPLTYYYHC